MPQIFKIGGYVIYFWLNENKPLEPIHIHASKGIPSENATKIWLTKTGRTLLCHNNSKIPAKQLRIIMETVSARHEEIEEKWKNYFHEIRYYC